MSDTLPGTTPDVAAVIRTLPPQAAKLMAIEILLAESLADDVLGSWAASMGHSDIDLIF